MKTFKQFILEANPPKPNAVSKMTRNFQRRYKGSTFYVTKTKDGEGHHIGDLWFPPEQRNKGLGSKALGLLHKVAGDKPITLKASPEEGEAERLHNFYTKHGYERIEGTNRYIRRPKSVDEEWIPPASKRLRGGRESPLSIARKRGTDLNKVRSSVHRFAEPINKPQGSEYDFEKDKTGKIIVRSKKHPIEVSFTPGDKPNSYIQNARMTGNVEDRISAGREMQRIKKDVTSAARPGTEIYSQPINPRRSTLNTRTQGMSPTDERGVQGGIVRHRSPKQKAKGAKPLDPLQYKGIFIDPNHE